MKNVTFGFRDMHEHGRAFYDYLALRKRLFVDTLAWDIPHDDVVEMDQYDTPQAYYSVVLDNGSVVGGARILPLEAVWGAHGSMLLDATRGMLDGIPANILDDSFDPTGVWECTRLAISDTLVSARDRNMCLTLIVEGLVQIATRHDARQMVSLSPPPLMRALRGLGYQVERISTPYRNNSDGRIYTVLRMPARRAADRTEAHTDPTRAVS